MTSVLSPKEWMRKATFPFKRTLLSRSCHRIQGRAAGGYSLRHRDLARLAFAWGNPGYAAGISYLRHVGERAGRTHGTILECGSGATTLLIAALTAEAKVNFVVLEHDPNWHRYLKRMLDALGYAHVRLVHAPLQDYGTYAWYRPPAGVVPKDVGLVICDGPPGSIPGGRFGLMPVMASHLKRDCVILLDDTHRAGERRILDAWRRYRCLTSQRLGSFGSHAEVVCC